MNKIGIIGYGNMGAAIGERVKVAYPVSVFEKDKSKFSGITGVAFADTITQLVAQSDVVILAVKPQDFETVLNEMRCPLSDKLVISIAAGITTSYIEKKLSGVKVVRVMPNLPAKIGKGMICLCKGRSACDDDLRVAMRIFKYLGTSLLVNEEEMDAVTAISGSGPGYLYYYMEQGKDRAFHFATALTSAAVAIGFSESVAKILAQVTREGSIAYLKEMKLSPEEAKKQVASKGGTTQAGLDVLANGGSLLDAVEAAKRRAKELSTQ